MKHYIAYLDVLGAKNSSENENFEDYLSLITNFQNELLGVVHHLKNSKGRIHFFSDCAFIESKDIIAILSALMDLRKNLFDAKIFVRGAISDGILGAINGFETEEFINSYYEDSQITEHLITKKNSLLKYQDNIRGTLFFSKDLAKIVMFESNLKGASIYIDEKIVNAIPEKRNYITKSGFVRKIEAREYVSFSDIKYEPDFITDTFLNHVFTIYYKANMYDISYGRFYLSILISCVNSCDFKKIKYNIDDDIFEEAPMIFYKVMNLRKEHKQLYDSTKGLEFLYLSLINKVYSDINKNNMTTMFFLKKIFENKRYLSYYRNKFSRIPKDLLSSRAKKLLIEEFSKLATYENIINNE